MRNGKDTHNRTGNTRQGRPFFIALQNRGATGLNLPAVGLPTGNRREPFLFLYTGMAINFGWADNFRFYLTSAARCAESRLSIITDRVHIAFLRGCTPR